MQPRSERHLRWIDHHWGAICEVFPTFTMNWLYQEYGADRLKHHRWMLTRPSFVRVARGLHQTLAVDGEIVIRSVEGGTIFKFPDGIQRALASKFFHRLQKPDGAETTMFLFAIACELTGITPFCAYQDAALRRWMKAADSELVPHYGTSYNLLFNVVAQTMLWVLGCFPYAKLQQQIGITAGINLDLLENESRELLLAQHCLAINEQLKRISRHPTGSRTYRESEVH